MTSRAFIVLLVGSVAIIMGVDYKLASRKAAPDFTVSIAPHSPPADKQTYSVYWYNAPGCVQVSTEACPAPQKELVCRSGSTTHICLTYQTEAVPYLGSNTITTLPAGAKADDQGGWITYPPSTYTTSTSTISCQPEWELVTTSFGYKCAKSDELKEPNR